MTEQNDAAGRITAYLDARVDLTERGANLTTQIAEAKNGGQPWARLTTTDLRTVLAELADARRQLAALKTEWGVRWRPRNGRYWIDDDIDGATEAAARAHAATRPEGRAVSRLVGAWTEVDKETT